MSDIEYWDTYSGEPLSDHELHERYDDLLDEVYGDVCIGAWTYPASRTLRDVDPIAYRCGYNDWLDSELQDGVITDTDPAGDD